MSARHFRKRLLFGAGTGFLLLAVLTEVALLVSVGPGRDGGSASSGSTGGSPRLEVVLVTRTSRSDRAYGRQHHEGLRGLFWAFGTGVATRMVENVGTDARRVFQELCDSGTDLIIATTSEYEDALLATARKNPKIRFLHCFGTRRTDNVATCGMRDWEGAYVCGALSAMTVEGKRLGFVAPHPTRPTPWIVNAFALGAQSVHPETAVEVAYLGSWHDPRAEERAVAGLLKRDVGAIYFMTFRPFAGFRAAERAGVYVLHHFADLREFARRKWLTGTVWHWSPLYVRVTQQILDDRWSSGHHELGFEEGALSLATFGPEVGTKTWTLAGELVAQISSGGRQIFVGPLHDQAGQLRVAEGEILGPQAIRACGWILQGIREVPTPGS